jgi:hypothetical protein
MNKDQQNIQLTQTVPRLETAYILSTGRWARGQEFVTELWWGNLGTGYYKYRRHLV